MSTTMLAGNGNGALAAEWSEQRRQALMADVDKIRYTAPALSPTAPITFAVPDGRFVPQVDCAHPFYREQHDRFMLKRYECSRPPLDLGHSLLGQGILEAVPSVLRLPIKMPGSDYRVPVELEPLRRFLWRVARYESAINPRHSECFVHITVDAAVITTGTTHRFPGWHGDGVQGAKFSQPGYAPAEHSYILASEPPTEFCLQPFFLRHLNDARDNIFYEFEVQAREANVFRTIPWHLYLLDPYMVHRTPAITSDAWRAFVRVTFAYSELMSPHNTVNPHFAGQRYADRWDIREFLTLHEGEVPWSCYGFSTGPERQVGP